VNALENVGLVKLSFLLLKDVLRKAFP
jgi:hypothetical protein